MKIKTYDELNKLNETLTPIQKKISTKQKALLLAKKKVDKLENEILELEAEIEKVLNGEEEYRS